MITQDNSSLVISEPSHHNFFEEGAILYRSAVSNLLSGSFSLDNRDTCHDTNDCVRGDLFHDFNQKRRTLLYGRATTRHLGANTGYTLNNAHLTS